MMEETILEAMRHFPEEGALRFKDVRYLLIRPETLAAFQRALEDEVGPGAAGRILYPGGYTGGRLSGQKYKQVFGLSDREAVEFMCRMGGEIGWGAFRLHALEEDEKRLEVDVHNSPFAAAYEGEASSGVCHLIRGVLAGLGAGVFGVDVEARETRCLALGDDVCRFKVEATV